MRNLTDSVITLSKATIIRTRIEAARRNTTIRNLTEQVMNGWLDKNEGELSYKITMTDDVEPESDGSESEQPK